MLKRNFHNHHNFEDNRPTLRLRHYAGRRITVTSEELPSMFIGYSSTTHTGVGPSSFLHLLRSPRRNLSATASAFPIASTTAPLLGGLRPTRQCRAPPLPRPAIADPSHVKTIRHQLPANGRVRPHWLEIIRQHPSQALVAPLRSVQPAGIEELEFLRTIEQDAVKGRALLVGRAAISGMQIYD